MRASRVDANQPTIVQALRAAGAAVAHTHMVGDGFPDLEKVDGMTRRVIERGKLYQAMVMGKLTTFERWEAYELFNKAGFEAAITYVQDATLRHQKASNA